MSVHHVPNACSLSPRSIQRRGADDFMTAFGIERISRAAKSSRRPAMPVAAPASLPSCRRLGIGLAAALEQGSQPARGCSSPARRRPSQASPNRRAAADRIRARAGIDLRGASSPPSAVGATVRPSRWTAVDGRPPEMRFAIAHHAFGDRDGSRNPSACRATPRGRPTCSP